MKIMQVRQTTLGKFVYVLGTAITVHRNTTNRRGAIGVATCSDVNRISLVNYFDSFQETIILHSAMVSYTRNIGLP